MADELTVPVPLTGILYLIRITEFYAEISGISLAAFEANINGTIQNEFNFEIAVTATLNSAINSTEIHSDDVGIGADIGPGRDPAKAASTVGFTASVTTHAWQDFKSMQAEVHENTEHFQAALTAELRKFPAFKDARVTVLEPADPTTPAPPTTAAPGGGPAAAPGGGGGGGSSSGASAGTIGGAAAAALGVALVGLAVQRRQQRKFRREQQASAAVAELEEGAGAAEDAAAAAALNKPLLETSGCQTDRLIVEPAPTTTPEEPEQVWERQGTEVSVLQRQRESGATLVSKRLHIVGKGTGVVIGTVQAKGRKTRHTVQFADGRKETVLLQKQSNQRDGDKFYVEELVDTTE
eukprot:g4551.t1